MLKVTKFGGSSMADAGQYRKVKDIILADRERRVVIVSAAGKRFSGDHKLTDLLYLCYAHIQYGGKSIYGKWSVYFGRAGGCIIANAIDAPYGLHEEAGG